MNKTVVSCLCIFFLSLCNSFANELVWKTYSLDEVTLTQGFLKEAMDRHATYVLSLEPDRLIPHVRRMAGLPAKGSHYGGWETRGGCTYGHYLSSCAMYYQATGNEAFASRIDYLLNELDSCRMACGDGFFTSSQRARKGLQDLRQGKIWLGEPDETGQPWTFNGIGNIWYSVHKVMAGLRDAYTFAGREKALDLLKGIADYIVPIALESNRDLFQASLAVEQGGMCEVFVDLYRLTGNEDYLKTARRFVHQEVVLPLALGQDVLFGRHANDQIPKFIGAAALCEVCDDPVMGNVSANFWQTVTEHHTLAIGGNSCYERFGLPDEESKRLDYSSAETCNTYNMLRLSRQLFLLSGDVKYLNYSEGALYNHILASQDPDMPGCVTYYTSLGPGMFKQYSTPYESFWCCVGTGLENHAKYGESVFFHNGKQLLVNCFVSCHLSDSEAGTDVVMDTRFPESDTVRLHVRSMGNLNGGILVRRPSWLHQTASFRINGAVVNPKEKDGFYHLNVQNNCDIEIVFPRDLWLRYANDEPDFATVMYGPLVLGGLLGKEGMPEDRVSDNRECRDVPPIGNIPMLVGDTANLSSWIIKGERDGDFHVANRQGESDVELVPYWRLHHQRYTVYWKLYTEERFALRRQCLTDEVNPTDEADCKKHNLQGDSTSVVWHEYFWAKNSQCRVAGSQGWFSFRLSVNRKETKPYYLILKCWGDERNAAPYDVFVDNVKVATINPDRHLFLSHIDEIIPLDAELTRNKKNITVRFQGCDGGGVAGLYNLKITTDPSLK